MGLGLGLVHLSPLENVLAVGKHQSPVVRGSAMGGLPTCVEPLRGSLECLRGSVVEGQNEVNRLHLSGVRWVFQPKAASGR